MSEEDRVAVCSNMCSQEATIENLQNCVCEQGERQDKFQETLEKVLIELKNGSESFDKLFRWKEIKTLQNGYDKDALDAVKNDVKDKADKSITETTLKDVKDEIKELRRTFIYGIAAAVIVVYILPLLLKTLGT